MYRKNTVKDCEAVYKLICELECKELSFNRFSEIYNKQLNDKHYYCLVYEHNDQIIGVLNLRFEEQLHHAEYIAEIMEFTIHSAYRNKGIGKKMFSTACQIAKEMGCEQIEAASNQLRENTHRFYLREGMHNFHFKFSKSLTETDTAENAIGR